MYDYREYCPIAKAVQILCERWTVLIVREMLMGATRFNELRRYLPRISPSLLKSRLQMLEEQGIIARLRIPEQRGYEYHLTASGRELDAVIMALGSWAVRWQYDTMEAAEINVEALMRDVQHLLVPAQMPRPQSVLRFLFSDVDHSNRWYVVIDHDRSEICDEDRAFEVDVYLSTDRKTLADILLGATSLKQALADGRVLVTGVPAYIERIGAWLGVSAFAAIARPDAA